MDGKEGKLSVAVRSALCLTDACFRQGINGKTMSAVKPAERNLRDLAGGEFL
jgi:hypothetical protein